MHRVNTCDRNTSPAQALGWLGAAANPMITGLILTHLPHWSLFIIMMAAIIAARLMILRGMRVKVKIACRVALRLPD